MGSAVPLTIITGIGLSTWPQSRFSFAGHDVKEVIVRVATKEAAVVNNRDIPDICLQHMVAVMLLDGTASFASAHDVARMQTRPCCASARR
jgi:hypothetical protein